MVLPGRSKPQQHELQAPVRDALQQRFQASVGDLRRSFHLSVSKEQALLLRLAESYDAPAERAIKLARQARPDLMHGVMLVLQTYGGPQHAKEIRFLLLTRKLGKATSIAVETMHSLAGDQGKQYLFDCLVAANSTLRRHAAEMLHGRVGSQDVSRLIEISESKLRVKPKVLHLLGSIPNEAACDYLVETLSAKALHAEQACRGLIAQGVAAVPQLKTVLSKTSMGRAHAYAYAAFALASIGEETGQQLFTDEMTGHLLEQLAMPDAFINSAAAIALAGMAWNSTDSGGQIFADTKIANYLVRAVAPDKYIAHLSLIQPIALRQLTRFSGMGFDRQTGQWKRWVRALDPTAYVGNRRYMSLDETDADLAVFTWHDRDQTLRFRGPGAGKLEELDQSSDYVLSGEEILGLFTSLSEAGFMAAGQPTSSVIDSRSLQLAVGAARCRTEPAVDRHVLDGISVMVNRFANEQRWQVYRDPKAEPDPVKSWRLEQQWVVDHPSEEDRNRRLKERILAVLPTLEGSRFESAVQHLASLSGLRELLEPADGASFMRSLRARSDWDEVTFELLALSLLVPGDVLWPQLLSFAEERFESGGQQAMAKIFALLGPDRILAALRTGSKLVRLSVMNELAQLRDLRAIPSLLDLVDSDDVDLRQSAIYVLGKLQAPAARSPLLDLLAEGQQALPPSLRRATWVALARIGGDGVLAVLRDAAKFTDQADREAVIRSLGALEHPNAAVELARMYAYWGDNAYGQLALHNLRMKGDLVASPILEGMLKGGNQHARPQIVRLLGEFQNPAALEGLFEALKSNAQHLREITLIAEITGQDVAQRNDRTGYLRAWWRANFTLPQAAWFLSALDESGIKHSLQLEQLRGSGDLSALPELTRILIESPVPCLRSLAARMLRIVTHEDYGIVSSYTDENRCRAIAERYLFLIEEEEGK